MSQIAAEFKTGAYITSPITGLAKYEFTNMTATSTSGFRFGVNYAPNDDWGLGLSYRSSVAFEATGDGERYGKLNVNGAKVGALAAEDEVSVSSQFPQQIAFGGHYRLAEFWTLYSELWWTNYSTVQKLEFESDTSAVERAVELEWNDQTNLRLAASFTKFKLPINFGYIYTTPAASKGYALPTLSTPEVGHSVTLGTFGMVSEKVELSSTIEYSSSTAEVTDAESSTTAEGTYSSSALALHLGLNIGF